jgi:uncharacterized RDD family membrane protein YckC
MTSAERLCMVAARSEALLADFVVLFVIRWAIERIGVEYVYFQPVLDQVSPPLSFADLHYPVSALLWGSMYFISGLPELVLAGMWCLYAVISLSIFGQTLGMRQAGIRLVDVFEKRPAVWRVILRQMVAPLSSIAWLGYWPVIVSPDARPVHDLIAGTKMAYTDKKPEPAQPA